MQIDYLKEVLEKIKEEQIDTLSRRMSLGELQLDSIQMMMLLVELEEKFKKEIDPSFLSPNCTIGDLEDLFLDDTEAH